MPTLMSKETFERLSAARNDMKNDGLEPAGIFVPWIGEAVKSGSGGIYYVGIASEGKFNADKEIQTIDTCYEYVCDEKDRFLEGTLFWRFLTGLTTSLLGDTPKKTTKKWGWSNLMKIGCAAGGTPSKRMCSMQMKACGDALREELSQLGHTLIVVATANDADKKEINKELLEPPIIPDMSWRPIASDTPGPYVAWDERTKNLYVHMPHPHKLLGNKQFNPAMENVISLTRKHFSWPVSERAE